MMHARFYNTRGGEFVQALGSDSYCPIDGRLSVPSAIMVAARQVRRLKAVQSYTALQVFRNDRPVTGVIPVVAGS